MKALSLKLDDGIFEETERLVSKSKISRNRYINEAIKYYNDVKNRELLAEQLKRESKIVAEESMKVLDEFETIEDNDQAV